MPKGNWVLCLPHCPADQHLLIALNHNSTTNGPSSSCLLPFLQASWSSGKTCHNLTRWTATLMTYRHSCLSVCVVVSSLWKCLHEDMPPRGHVIPSIYLIMHAPECFHDCECMKSARQCVRGKHVLESSGIHACGSMYSGLCSYVCMDVCEYQPAFSLHLVLWPTSYTHPPAHPSV